VLRRDRDQLAILSQLQGPTLFVHQSVMPATQKDQVVERGRTAIRPMFDVMRIRPRRRAVSAGIGCDHSSSAAIEPGSLLKVAMSTLTDRCGF
jgi:hypothetical protein